jgi:alginate O-acetyltransferase complex protein AlgI
LLFSSQLFVLLFLPLALALYHALAGDYRARLWALTLASFAFYGWWDLRFLPLLIAAITLNWGLGHVYMRLGRPRWLIVAGVAFHLLLLGFFKYANFFADALGAFTGIEHQRWSIVLPLAISFFTFQQISYLVDLKRGTAPPYTWLEYTAYIVFFPHLIAGPIVRHNELIGQFAQAPHRDGALEMAARGLLLFTLGLVKKVFFADELAGLADPVFDAAFAGSAPQPANAWLAALAYSLQLYFDFSAYSDMAIGLGAMFGLRLPLNFDEPYRATSIRDFWRRWHMTLSRFLRDYLYIPLGGSHRGPLATAVIVMTTMTLCGLWHGAGWTFITWGALHGLAIVGSRAWALTGIRLPAVAGWALTMLFVIIGWVLFRASDFDAAALVLAGMAGQGATSGVPAEGWILIAIGAACAVFGPTNIAWAEQKLAPRAWVAVLGGFALFVVTLRVGQGRGLDFIYFQF